MIITNFYARLSRQDKDLLDASSIGSFTNKKIDAKLELLERIQRNTEDWEIDKGKESCINYEYDCIKSFFETASFNKFSDNFGLDSQLLFGFLKSFSSHLNMPKENWFNKMELLMIIATCMIQFLKVKFYISMLIFVEWIDLVKGL